MVPSASTATPEQHDCAVQLTQPPPTPATLATAEPPRSELSVGMAVATAKLAAEIDKHVPRGLGSASRQPVGSAGEVTYNVTRGGFAFALKDDRLLVTTPIAVSVSICKPLGPICPTYGRCSPRLSAVASVPLTLGSNYQLAEPALSYGISEGCNIAGLDQTSRIRSLADKQIAAVRGQIQQAVPEIEPQARAVLAEVTKPRALEGGGCVTIAADRVVQAKPQLVDGVISVRAIASGVVELSRDACGPAKAAKLPALSVLGAKDTAPTQSRIAAALTVSWDELTEHISEQVSGAALADGTQLGAVTVQPGELGGKPTVVLGITMTGRTCGQTWVSAELVADLAASTLRLQNVQPLAGHAEHDGLAAALTERGKVPIPSPLLGAQTALERLTSLAVPKEVPATLDVKLAPAKATTLPHGGGVMVIVERQGTIDARVK